MSRESHVKPSPRVHHSTPRRIAISRSPTFHRSDFTNWITHTFQPRATARSAVPKAAVDLPLPFPVFTITTDGALREALGGACSGASGGLICAREPPRLPTRSYRSPLPPLHRARRYSVRSGLAH